MVNLSWPVLKHQPLEKEQEALDFLFMEMNHREYFESDSSMGILCTSNTGCP
jgi:hypothetical protein